MFLNTVPYCSEIILVKALTGGVGADVVFEVAGSAELFNAASAMIKHNDKFVFYSWVTTPITLNISR